MPRYCLLLVVFWSGVLAGALPLSAQFPPPATNAPMTRSAAAPITDPPPATTTLTPATARPYSKGHDTAAQSPITSDAQTLEECEVIAKIDGQVVQACEVLWRVDQSIGAIEKSGQSIPPDELEQVREFFIRREIATMVDTKLLYADFRRSDIPQENLDKIFEKLQQPFEEDYVPRLLKQFEASDVIDLEKKLHAAGTSLEDMVKSYREQAIATQWLRTNIEFNEEVTHDEMLAYYHEHLAEYEYPTQARWEELMVRKNQFASRDQAIESICAMGNEAYRNAVARQLRGPIFGDVARSKSHGYTAQNGGLHDWTTQGAFKIEEMDRALFTLKVGQLSDLIETDSSLHIVRVLERKQAGQTPFTEVQNDIVDAIKNRRFGEAVSQYLAKLRSNGRIWTVYTGDTTIEMLAQPPGETVRR